MNEPLEPTEPNIAQGREILWRLLLPHAWVHRRVETVRFVDEDTLRRSVSVDCDAHWPSDAGPGYLPLARIEKRPLTSFDLRDEGGRALPVLTTSENGFLAWSALVAAAEVVLEAPVPRSIQISLHAIVFTDPRSNPHAVKVVRDLAIDRSARRKLFASPGVQGLVEGLAAGFLLMTPVLTADMGRRIFKYAYTQPMARDRHAIKESLGLRPLSIDFDVPLVGEAQGYHLECEVPVDLQIADARLVASSDDEEREGRAVGQGERVHVFLSGVDPVVKGVATVSLVPSVSGMLRATTLSMGVITASLLAGACFGHRITAGSDAAAAILVLLPGILSAAISRPGEHRLASLILRGLRWCVALASGCSFAAAGLIALEVEGSALRWSFLGLAVVSGACVVVAGGALRVARLASQAVRRT